MTKLGNRIDSDRSQIQFTTTLLGLITVPGTLSGLRGAVLFDPEQPEQSHFKVCADARTIDTGLRVRDQHLQKAAFFDTAHYRDICFSSSYVRRNGDHYEAQGELQIKGIHQRVTMPFRQEGEALLGEFQIDRQAFELGTLPTFVISKTIRIRIVCTLR